MITGYTMLHYGKDYLAHALHSLEPYVDRHVILYSATPTFGSTTNLPCPDTRDELYAIARDMLRGKLKWHEGYRQNYETVMGLYPDTSLILEVDADEVYRPALIATVLRNYREGRLKQGRHTLPMAHHWRSFNYICRDNSFPTRLYVANQMRVGNYPRPIDSDDAFIHHFGYARGLYDTSYKIETSAHKGEWRKDWLRDIFLRFPDRLIDLHPVVKDLWTAEPYDKRCLPDFMRLHPFYDKAVVE